MTKEEMANEIIKNLLDKFINEFNSINPMSVKTEEININNKTLKDLKNDLMKNSEEDLERKLYRII